MIKYAVLYRTLERIAEGKWRVYYRNYLLGYCDEKETRIMDDQGRFRRAEKKCKGCVRYLKIVVMRRSITVKVKGDS